MGIWAEIKHALNSTLGTDEFVPLDKIYKNQVVCVPSNDVFKSFPSAELYVFLNKVESKILEGYCKIKTKVSGSFYFNYVAANYSEYVSPKGYFLIYINGSLKKREEIKVSGEDRTIVIDFKAGDLIQIDLLVENTEIIGSGSLRSGYVIKESSFSGKLIPAIIEM